jgi:predicted Fe-S protein YdhL (DUF1289 family)
MNEVPSPCVDICDVDESCKYCIGCGRSLDEIAAWLSINNEQRQAIVEQLPERLKHLKA